MKYNIKLSLKAIIRTEQLLNKPFSAIDYANEDEVKKLIYCAVLANNPTVITYEAFCTISENKKQFASMIREVETVNKVLVQFSPKEKETETRGEKTESWVKDIAGMLILSGISAEYVMNEMEIFDIPILLDALKKKKQEEMEMQRVWTYLGISPHVNTKNMTPVDFYTFPWEMEERIKTEEAHEQRSRDILADILNFNEN